MAKNNLFDSSQSKRVQKSISRRKGYKEKIDRLQKFGLEDKDDLQYGSVATADLTMPTWTRLMDEGVFVDEDSEGEPVVGFVIAKGAIKRMYDAMPDDYEGYIDKDHNRSLYLGKFTKADLRLIEIENDRYGLDVNVKLDNSLNAVADLIREDAHRAVSIEINMDDYEMIAASKLTEEAKYGDNDYFIPLVNEFTLKGYGVVRNPRDPNAYNEQLLSEVQEKGEPMDEEDKKAAIEQSDAVESTSNDEPKVAEVAEVETEAPAVEEKAEVAEPQAEETVAEETAPATEPEGETEAEDKGTSSEQVEASIEELGKAITELQAQIADKDAQIAELKKKLSTESVAQMSIEKKVGMLLASVQATAKTEAEGGKVSSIEAETDKAFIDSAKAAFANL